MGRKVGASFYVSIRRIFNLNGEDSATRPLARVWLRSVAGPASGQRTPPEHEAEDPRGEQGDGGAGEA